MLIFQVVENIGMCLFVMDELEPEEKSACILAADFIGGLLFFIPGVMGGALSLPSSPPWGSSPACGAGPCRIG